MKRSNFPDINWDLLAHFRFNHIAFLPWNLFALLLHHLHFGLPIFMCFLNTHYGQFCAMMPLQKTARVWLVIKTHLITPFHWLESAHLGEETNHLWHQFLLIFARCNCISNIFLIASTVCYIGTLFTGIHWLRNAYLCEQTNHPWHSNHWWVTRTKLHLLLWHLHCVALHCIFEETKHLWHSNHWLVTGTN